MFHILAFVRLSSWWIFRLTFRIGERFWGWFWEGIPRLLPSLFPSHRLKARHLVSASRGMRSIMETDNPNKKLMLDDMPLFLKVAAAIDFVLGSHRTHSIHWHTWHFWGCRVYRNHWSVQTTPKPSIRGRSLSSQSSRNRVSSLSERSGRLAGCTIHATRVLTIFRWPCNWKANCTYIKESSQLRWIDPPQNEMKWTKMLLRLWSWNWELDFFGPWVYYVI